MKNIFILCVFLAFSAKTFAVAKTWVGKGSGGTGTDFNNGSNWSPTGVPGAADNVTIAITSTATITLSNNITVNNLTYTVATNNKVAIIDVGNYTLTINGTSTIDAVSGNNGTIIYIGVNNSSGTGVIVFSGNVSIGPTSNSAAASFLGNSNSKLTFKANLTIGDDTFLSTSSGLLPGTFEFDGTGTQTITWNNTNYYCRFKNVVIGNTNNPTVVQTTGTIVPDEILGDLTVNGSSVLDLGTSIWNRNSAGGTLTLSSTSKLLLGASTGGQTGSNFPSNFSSYSIAAGSTVEYDNTSAQTIYDIASPGYGNLTLTNNSIKTAGGGLDIRGNLLLNSTATFAGGTGLSHNITGNWTNSGAFTVNTSTIVLNGSAQQIIGGSTATTFYNLTINNTANNPSGDIILNNKDITITGTCTFTDGIVNSVTSNMVIFNDNAIASGANNASYVNVQVRKIGNDAFTFPIGKLTVAYMLCGISAPASTTDAFTAEYKRNSATALGSITASGLYRVSGCEYWVLDRTTGTSTVNVTLSWSGLSPCNAAAYVNSLASLVVAHFNGTNWNSYGNSGGTTGTGAAGTVTWNSVSVFSPFTLGSTSAIANPLPIKFSDVKAYSVSTGNKVEWKNITEEDLLKYEVERSGNGTSFTSILSVTPKANNGQEQDYAITDEHILSGTNFYRIKAIELDGTFEYSAIVRVNALSNDRSYAVTYPNPVVSDQFTLQLNNYKHGDYSLKLISANGQQLMSKTIQHPGGSVSITIDKPVAAQAGLYFLQVTGETVTTNMKVLIK